MRKNKFLVGALAIFIACILLSGIFPGYTQTFTKRLISNLDIAWATGGTGAAETFTATAADGKTLTFEKVDATHLKFRSLAKSIEDLIDGGKDVHLKPSSLSMNGTLTNDAMSVAGYVKNSAAGVLSGGNSIAAGDLPAASTTAQGAVELATDAETQTGTDATRAVTPAGLASVTASETRAGLVERATDAEAVAMADTTRYISPAQLALLPYFDIKFAQLSDSKAANTAGGTFTAGDWRTRTINTEDSDVDNIVTINANQFTLAAGTYWIIARAPAYAVNAHKARIRNITDGTTDLLGSSAGSSLNAVTTDSTASGKITIAGAKVFELQHRCTTTNADDGFGLQCNFGENEIYSTIMIWKIE